MGEPWKLRLENLFGALKMKALSWWLMVVGSLRLASVWFGFFDIWALRLAVFSKSPSTSLSFSFLFWSKLLLFLCSFHFYLSFSLFSVWFLNWVFLPSFVSVLRLEKKEDWSMNLLVGSKSMKIGSYVIGLWIMLHDFWSFLRWR